MATFEPGALYCGDALKVLATFPEAAVDLVYVDPPFFSNKNYELVWGNGYELKAYEDRWKGGIENYIAWMEPRVRLMHRVLKPTGTFWLHCDHHASGHLRVLLDKVFGHGAFRNEVVWCYSGGGTPREDFPRKHDTLYRYANGERWTFNVERKPFKENTQQVGKHSTLAKRYGSIDIDLVKGTPITDWWTDINTVTGWAPEKLGYPTQKPEALLRRVIETTSNKEDLVLDPMMGGGTTVAVAQKLGRRWVGIDVSPLAVKMAAKRLRKLGTKPHVLGMPMSIEALKALQPYQFEQWALDILFGHPVGITPQKGIDGFLLDGRPVEVKQQENVGRPTVDKFETALKRLDHKAGVIVAFSFTKGAVEERARALNAEGLDIELKTVRSILRDVGAHESELKVMERDDGEE